MSFILELRNAFPSVAQTLLDTDAECTQAHAVVETMQSENEALKEKMKIAREALEAIDSPHVEKTMWEVTAKKRGIAKEALSRIRSLP